MITKVTAHVVRNSCAKIYRLNCMVRPLTLGLLDNTSASVNAKTLIVSAHGFNGLIRNGRSDKDRSGQHGLTWVKQLCFIVSIDQVGQHPENQ